MVVIPDKLYVAIFIVHPVAIFKSPPLIAKFAPAVNVFAEPLNVTSPPIVVTTQPKVVAVPDIVKLPFTVVTEVMVFAPDPDNIKD